MELRDRHAAAIASEAAAQYYGAQILQADIEDNPENYTRFFLVRRTKDAVADRASNKVSVAFSVENRAGSLVSALAELSALGVNLTKIESRPVHGRPWEYIFYVDCQIHAEEEATCSMRFVLTVRWSRNLVATRKRRNRRRNPETCLNPFGGNWARKKGMSDRSSLFVVIVASN